MGIALSGVGVKLQSLTPGTPQAGSFNITGTGLAGGFSTSNGVNNAPEIFGRGNGALASYGPLSAVFGVNNTGVNQAVGSIVTFGVNNTTNSQGSVTLGLGNVAGNAGGFASLAVGVNCSAGAGAGEGSQRVAYGWNCTASGGRNVVFGNAVNLSNTNGANSQSTAFGQDISCGATATQNVLLGMGIAPNSRANVLAVGGWGAGIGLPAYPASGAGQVDNSVLIGNVNQTVVQIGAYALAASILPPCLVAGLPAGSVNMRGFVTNALAPAFGAAVAGGGAVGVPVYHDGTSWKVG